jgi:hypothetical protein
MQSPALPSALFFARSNACRVLSKQQSINTLLAGQQAALVSGLHGWADTPVWEWHKQCL